MQKDENSFHIHMISDATGETLLATARAVSAQYAEKTAIEHVYAMIRSKEQLTVIFQEIRNYPGIVLYTVLDQDLIQEINNFCKKIGFPYVAVLEPLLMAFQSYLDKPSKLKASAQHVLDDNYFNRIAALDYTMAHDDGIGLSNLNEADVVIVGISRTSKTPTSIYLAHRGIKTANVPLVPYIPLPREVEELNNPLIVGLVASANRIAQIRQNRFKGQSFQQDDYINQRAILEELSYARRIFNKNKWPVLDVTRRSIEETAANILDLLQQHKRKIND